MRKFGKSGVGARLASTALIGGIAGLALLPTNQAFSATVMDTGGYTSQPIGHYEFCRRSPRECNQRNRRALPVHLTKSAWNTITRVNSLVNKRIKPMNDIDVYGKEEVWNYPIDVGDCEDYVLLKRKILIQKGIAPSNLLITVVRKRDGEGHAVLTVRTTKGDFILDNLRNSVKHWNRTGYRYLKRQAETHTGRWVTIRGSKRILTSSLDN